MITADPIPLTEQQIQDWLIERISAILEIEPSKIEVQKNLGSYGLDSLHAAQISGDLEDLLYTELSPALLYDYPSIELLSRHLARPDPVESMQP